MKYTNTIPSTTAATVSILVQPTTNRQTWLAYVIWSGFNAYWLTEWLLYGTSTHYGQTRQSTVSCCTMWPFSRLSRQEGLGCQGLNSTLVPRFPLFKTQHADRGITGKLNATCLHRRSPTFHCRTANISAFDFLHKIKKNGTFLLLQLINQVLCEYKSRC